LSGTGRIESCMCVQVYVFMNASLLVDVCVPYIEIIAEGMHGIHSVCAAGLDSRVSVMRNVKVTWKAALCLWCTVRPLLHACTAEAAFASRTLTCASLQKNVTWNSLDSWRAPVARFMISMSTRTCRAPPQVTGLVSCRESEWLGQGCHASPSCTYIHT
jgi:hypothetical protein